MLTRIGANFFGQLWAGAAAQYHAFHRQTAHASSLAPHLSAPRQHLQTPLIFDRWVVFEELFARIAGRFAQACSRKRARAYLLGLLSCTERKNGWTIAELAGDATPDAMQRLLNFYSWSADEVRDDLRAYVAAAIGDVGGVLIPDETGFLKKGTKSAGGWAC